VRGEFKNRLLATFAVCPERGTRATKAAMSGEPAQSTEDYVSLYRRAFKDFKARALWNVRELENPTPADALAITRSLRVEGDLNARRLAEQIEKVCRAAI
jgi:hypothetical protein